MTGHSLTPPQPSTSGEADGSSVDARRGEMPAAAPVVPELVKWPRLLVTGRAVTEAQANEILVRTAQWFMLSNDRAWMNTVMTAAGIELSEHTGTPCAAMTRRFEERLRVLPLRYLSNHRIASAWLLGPHGWCDWSGHIGTSRYNIGKWPTVEAVTEDWETIARAFPYLDLTAQLVNHEEDTGDGPPVVEWRVIRGRVAVDYAPDEPIVPVEPVELRESMMLMRLLSPVGERGVDEERLVKALVQVKNHFGIHTDFVVDAVSPAQLTEGGAGSAGSAPVPEER
jgi:hypothetical protein